jgi:hypothetical protein
MRSYLQGYVLTVALLSSVGCAAGAIDGPSSHGRAYTLTENALSFNGLVYNGLLSNGLELNGVRMNGVRMNGLAFNEFSLNGLSLDESISIIKYIVSCALPADHSMTFAVNDQYYTLPGGVALAPNFEFGPLSDQADQEIVSACLFARTNSIGNSVQISLRGTAGLIPTTDDERTRFTLAEGVYYGNVFTSPAYILAGPQTRLTAQLDINKLQSIGRGISWPPGPQAPPGALPLPGFTSAPYAHDVAYGWDYGACQGDIDGNGTFCHALYRDWHHPIFVNVSNDL